MVAEGEPLWLPEDTAYALAWQAEQDLTCDGCGQPTDESMSPEAEGAYKVSPKRCHACSERGRVSDDWHSRQGDSNGLYFAIRRERG